MATITSYNDQNEALTKDEKVSSSSNRSSFDLSNSSMSSSDGYSSNGSSISSSADTPISPIQSCSIIDNKLGRCVGSTVPFKWEEVPGKPLTACKSAPTTMTRDEAFPLQLPPCKALQGHHTPERYKSLLELITEEHDVPQLPANQSPFTPHSITQSPSRVTRNSQTLHLPNTQKVRSLCKSLLKSTSWKQPLNLSAPLHRILHGEKTGISGNDDAKLHQSPLPSPHPHRCGSMDSSSVDDQPLEPELVTLNDRFFFDKESPKDLKVVVTFMEPHSTFPLFDESPRHVRSLPIYDASQREDELVRKDALSFLLDMEMEDQHEVANTCSSPCMEPIISSGRWPTVTIVNLQERLQQDRYDDGKQDDGGGGVDYLGQCDFLSMVSSRGNRSQRIMNGDNETEYSIHSFRQGMSIDLSSVNKRPSDITCGSSSPPPAEVQWFLDFSPANEGADMKGANKMVSLAKSLALIKLKNLMMRKLGWMVKRRGSGGKAGKQQGSTMWSPTLATYLYNLQKERSGKVFHLSSTEDDEYDDDNGYGGKLKINYYLLPSTIRGQSVSLSEDEKPIMRDYTPQINPAAQEAKMPRSLVRGSFLHGRGHVATCKGMCKVQKTVGALAATIKLALEEKSKKLARNLRNHQFFIKSSNQPSCPCNTRISGIEKSIKSSTFKGTMESS